jgi:hypothetical protein
MKLNKYTQDGYVSLVPGRYQGLGTRCRGSSIKDRTLINAKYCLRALSVSSAIWLLALTGCSSIDGTAENHTVTTNLVTSDTEHGQEKHTPDNPPVSPDPDYNWFY